MTTAKEIRAEIKKELNLNARQISVRSDRGSFNVIVKVRGVNFAKLEDICKKFERVRRCEMSGDILSGGNTYVSVSTDYDLEQEINSEYVQQSQEIVDFYNGMSAEEAVRKCYTKDIQGKEVVFSFDGYNIYAGVVDESAEEGFNNKHVNGLYWVGWAAPATGGGKVTLGSFILKKIEG